MKYVNNHSSLMICTPDLADQLSVFPEILIVETWAEAAMIVVGDVKTGQQ